MCDCYDDKDLVIEFPAMGSLINEFQKLVEERNDLKREVERLPERIKAECNDLRHVLNVQKEVTAPDIALAQLWKLLNADNQTVAVIALTALINGYRWQQATKNKERIIDLVDKITEAEDDNARILASIDLDTFLIEVFGK